MSRIKWIVWSGLPASALLALYGYSAARYTSLCQVPRATCLEHRKAGCTISGVYSLRVANSVMEANCDMRTDSGGWTLIANYLHRGQSSDSTRTIALRNRFPLQRGTTLGQNEAGMLSWGHVNTVILGAFPFQEMRFRCQTSAHGRLVDFTLSDQRCLDYFRTGKGSCVDTPQEAAALGRSVRRLPGSEEFLPEVAVMGWKDQGDYAMVNYPFYVDWKHLWSVGAYGNRYECDDYEPGGTTNTWHQIWVR